MREHHLPLVFECALELQGDLGQGPKRVHCDRCDKTVHRLSNMTERGARRLLARRGGEDLCVAYQCDASGRVIFQHACAEAREVPELSERELATVRAPSFPWGAIGLVASTLFVACTAHDYLQEGEEVRAPPVEQSRGRAFPRTSVKRVGAMATAVEGRSDHRE